MKIDFKRGFTFIFKEEDWIMKILIGVGLSFAAAIISLIFSQVAQHSLDGSIPLGAKDAKNVYSLIGSIFSFPITALILGYVLNTAHNEVHDIPPRLPEWSGNFKKYLLQGLTSSAITFLYSILIGILAVIFVVVGFHNPLMIVFAIILGIPLIIFFALLEISASFQYIDNFNFSDAFNLQQVLLILSKAYPYFILVGLAIFISAIVVFFLLAITCIGIILIPAASFIIKIIALNLNAQIYKEAKQKI